MRELFRRQPKFTPAVEQEVTEMPNDLFFKCPNCKELSYAKEFREAQKVCQSCSYHANLNARERLELLLDPDSFTEWDTGLRAGDPLGFVAGPPGKEESYPDKLNKAIRKTGLDEALISGEGRIKDWPLAIVIAEFGFMGASMGSVYGEKLTRATERAVERRLPLLTVSASGGARMQEGLLSLMQMAKTTAALSRLSAARLPHYSLLVDPCFGGVYASYATIADLILAEPGARIGFAGTRVVEQTTRQKLPEGFHTAEFQLEHGMLDAIVPRRELRDTFATLLKLYTRGLEWQPLPAGVEPAATEVPVVFAVDTVEAVGVHSERD
jgi:acetyl-CoA carboxylase carboxyl transferase subunit beta